MVLYTPHTLVQFGGRLSQDASALTTYNEIWTASVRGSIGVDVAHPVTDCQAYMLRLQSALSAWFALPANNLSKMATLDWLKVNNINASGHYQENTTHQYDFPTLVRGGATGVVSSLPMFVTCAVTFLTDAGRGRASRGRISLPFDIQSATNSSPQILPAIKTSNANSVKALFTSLKAAGPPEGDFVPKVYSSVGAEWSIIRNIRVGNRMDTINRRKNAIPETPFTLVNYS